MSEEAGGRPVGRRPVGFNGHLHSQVDEQVRGMRPGERLLYVVVRVATGAGILQ